MSAFTEHRFDAEFVSSTIASNAATVKEDGRLNDYAGFLVGVFNGRLEKTGAIRYLDYGPYWWSVKAVLREYGNDLGDDDDAILREEYQGDSAAETLVMADLYRQQYLATKFIGNREMILTDTGETWILNDEDMEEKAMASA